MARETSVAIVGLGSRGLSVLERIVTLAKKAGPSAGPVRVEVIDPRCDGAGVHAVDQPDYLLLNTTCGCVSMFPDACTVGDEVDGCGPNLHEWVTSRGLRIGDDGFTVGSVGRPIRPTDFLPRRVLGEYLGWFLSHVLRRAPSHVSVRLHRASAVDLVPAADPDEDGLSLALSDGSSVSVRYAFLTTGYTPNSARDTHRRLIAEPYPLPARVAEIGAGETVAIGGFGLSAMDVMSSLTVGRGGRFVGRADEFRYLPSGREPAMLFYSRSGVPCRARPLVVEFGPQYQPLVFTTAAIDALRAGSAGSAVEGGPLEFETDVLPLILTEMRIAYRRCEARRCGDEAALARELAAAGERGGVSAIRAVLDGLDARHGRFDARSAFDGSADMLLGDADAYQDWLAGALRRDLAEGLLGFTRSPLKAALDIMRELRDTFRYVVDFGGLTDPSLETFNGQIVPAVNRAVVGPQYERHSELLALMAAGIAHVPLGPAPTVEWDDRDGRWILTSSRLKVPHSRAADWIVAAHVPLPAVACSASPLLAALHRSGRIRRHRSASRHVHGIDVDRDQHPLDAHGRPDRRIWVLGPLCEGATFYNNLVPSPNVYSRPVFDAHRCVAAMLAAAQAPLE